MALLRMYHNIVTSVTLASRTSLVSFTSLALCTIQLLVEGKVRWIWEWQASQAGHQIVVLIMHHHPLSTLSVLCCPARERFRKNSSSCIQDIVSFNGLWPNYESKRQWNIATAIDGKKNGEWVRVRKIRGKSSRVSCSASEGPLNVLFTESTIFLNVFVTCAPLDIFQKSNLFLYFVIFPFA